MSDIVRERLAGTVQSVGAISGLYTTSVGNSQNDRYSPLLVNDDGTICVAGNLIQPITFNPDTMQLAFPALPVIIKGDNEIIQGSITFSGPEPFSFTGTLTKRGQAPWAWSGQEQAIIDPPTIDNAVNAVNAFGTGDTCRIATPGGAYLAADPTTNLIKANADSASSALFTVTVQADGDGITLSTSAGAVYTTPAGLLAVATTGQAPSVFYPDGSTTGYAIFGTTAGGGSGDYWALQGDDSISVMTEEALVSQIQFAVSLTPVSLEALYARFGVEPSPALTPCGIAKAAFIWQVTGGLMLTVGLGPFMANSNIDNAVPNLLMRNANIATAINKAWPLIAAAQTPAEAAGPALSVLGAVYEEDMIYPLVMAVLEEILWYELFKVGAKVIQIAALPQAQAALMALGLAIWLGQTILAAQDVSSSCGSEQNSPSTIGGATVS